MKTKSIALAAVPVLAALAWSTACSKKPEPAAGTPTPTPSAVPSAIYYTGGQAGALSALNTSVAPLGGFTKPKDFLDAEGIAFNPANHTLYVADMNANTIRTFDAATGAETQIGFAKAAGLNHPKGLTLVNGRLLVANMSANNILAFDAATGAPVTAGFTSPAGLDQPFSVLVRGTTLYVGAYHLGAFDLATGAPVAGFTPPPDLRYVKGLALRGNAILATNGHDGDVGVYDATTGAEINAKFLTGLQSLDGLAILGDRLLVAHSTDKGKIGAYGLPAAFKPGEGPTSSAPEFLNDMYPVHNLLVLP